MGVAKFFYELSLRDVELISKAPVGNAHHYFVKFKIEPDISTIFELHFHYNEQYETYFADRLIHATDRNTTCYFCASEHYWCSLFQHFAAELLEIIKQHPQVRLKLLY